MIGNIKNLFSTKENWQRFIESIVTTTLLDNDTIGEMENIKMKKSYCVKQQELLRLTNYCLKICEAFY